MIEPTTACRTDRHGICGGWECPCGCHRGTAPPAWYDCCGHCEHGINGPPHDIPCPAGCNDAELGAYDMAPGAAMSDRERGLVLAADVLSRVLALDERDQLDVLAQGHHEPTVLAVACSRCGNNTWERFYLDTAPADVLRRPCVTDGGRYRIESALPAGPSNVR